MSQFNQSPKFILKRNEILYFFIFFSFLIWISCFPGLMSYDSLSQYKQSSRMLYSDGNPPIMAMFMTFLNSIYDSVGSIYTIHMFLYWASFSIIIWLFLKVSLIASLGIFLVAILPPSLSILPFIWKDVGMATFGLFIYSLLFYIAINGRFSFLIIMILFFLFIYVLNVRHNALAFVFPIVLYASYLFIRFKKYFWFKHIATGLSICIIFIIIFNYFFNPINPNTSQKYDMQKATLLAHYIGMHLNIENSTVVNEELRKKLIPSYKVTLKTSASLGSYFNYIRNNFPSLNELNNQQIIYLIIEDAYDNPLAFLKHIFGSWINNQMWRQGLFWNFKMGLYFADENQKNNYKDNYFGNLMHQYIFLNKDSMLYKGMLYFIFNIFLYYLLHISF